MNELQQAVRHAAARSEVAAAVEEVYRSVQSAVDLRRPVCVISGRCCRFEEYGHRLFVTTLELAAFVRRAITAPGAARLATLFDSWSGAGCPFQVAKLCGVHAIRPFGCRMFFCDASAGQWQQEQYELFHRDITRLHAELDVPYFYVEWRQGLNEVRELLSAERAKS